MVVAMVESPLLAALDGLASAEPWSLGEVSLAERAGELLRARDMVESLLAHTVAEARQRGLTGAAGYSNGWLPETHPVRQGRSAYTKVAVRARVISGLPLVASLHAGGEVSTAFLDAAGVGVDKLPEEALPTWDAMLAGEGRDLDPADIPKLLSQLRALVDPEQANRDADARVEKSQLRMSPFGSDGAWALNGTLYGLEGELVAAMLAHYAKPRDSGEDRSKAQRYADALVQICRMAQRAVGDPDFIPAPRGAAGHLVVYANISTWHGEPGAPAATTGGGGVVDPGQFEAVRCTTRPEVMLHDTVDACAADDVAHADADADSGVAASETETERNARLVRGILAGLLPPQVGIRIEPLAYAREARTASLAQWQMLVARDHHCVVEQCTRGPDWSEAHHLREWLADHGPTDLDNMALVCWQHHTWLHRMGLHLHPPWCNCSRCIGFRAVGDAGSNEWFLHTDAPVIGMP